VVFTADHGCDPTRPGSDHTREYVPVIAFGPGIAPGDIGRRGTFADIGQTIAQHLGLPPMAVGTSFL
jgi:phosphopentomutase